MDPDLLAELASSTEDAVVALVARWQAGELTDEEFVALATAALQRAQAEGYALTDVGVAAAAGKAALGLLPGAAAAARARATVQGIVAVKVEWRPTSTADRLAELEDLLREPGHDSLWYAEAHRAIKAVKQAATDVRAEVLETAQEAGDTATRRQDTPWRRRLNSGACKVCQDLAGATLPGHTEMYRHKGCGCTKQPINNEEGK